MTYEEAIERLKKRICQEGVYREDKTYHFCTDGCMYAEEECEVAIAIKAIEKQIPKKILVGSENCPSCGEEVVGCEFYCWACGQKLEW